MRYALLVSDIRYIGGHPVFEVQWDDDSEGEPPDAVRKNVKTAAGLRIVPVHPELIRLGFLDYVKLITATSPRGRLFPNLSLSKSGSYAANYSKWYANFLDHLGITNDRKNFHSFRHTFRDAVRCTNMPLERLNLLCGWKISGTEARYGGSEEVEASILTEEIGKVQYPTLCLDHLLPISKSG